MHNVIGPRVKQARLLCKPPLTQAELAARLQLAGLDLSREGVAKIEIGYREVKDYEVVALAKALGISVSWLLEENNAEW